MPERWERELEKLNEVDAPASTRSRIAEGPHGGGVPPSPGRSQRIVAGVVAFAIFGGAVALAYGGFGSDGEPVAATSLPPDAVVVTFGLRNERIPVASLEVGGSTFEGFGTSTCFEADAGDGLTVSNCMDTIAPEDYETTVGPWEYAPVVAGAPLLVQGSAVDVEGSVHDDAFTEIGSLRLVDRVGTVPDDRGRRFLVFQATWPGGDRSFYFPVEIVPRTGAQSPDALVADLRAPEDGSMPGLTLAYGRHEQEYFAQGGEWPGVNGFPMPLFSFPDPLIPGAPLRTDGDASSVEGELVIVRDDGSLSDETILLDLKEGVADLPTGAGVYELRLIGTWPRGTAAFFVRIQIGELEPVEPSPLPSVEPGVVPEVIGVGEGDAIKALTQAGYEVRSEYVLTDGVTAGIVVSSDPSPGTVLEPGSTVHLTVSGTRVALDGYLMDLACSAGDMMPFAHTGDVLQPAGESYIRVNVSGIQPSDALVRVFAEPNDDVGRGIWNLERNGQVLAVIDWETLQGIACRGSGVGGV